MAIKKVEFIPARKLHEDVRKQHNIKDGEYAEIKVVNPNEGIVIRKVKSPVREVAAFLKKKDIKINLD